MSGIQVSVVVPARNEEADIAAAVESLAAQTVPLEIIVANDRSTDRTGAILAGLRGRLPQLRVVETDELPTGWTGKSYAVACGVRQAGSPWLLLTDADVRHSPRAVEVGLEAARQTGAALVSFSPDQETQTWWERAVIPFVYCRLADEYPYDRISDPKDERAAANGQWLLVSRPAYEAVGGHAAVRNELLEDVALARLVKRAGFGVHFSRRPGLARTRMYSCFAEMWQGWSKNLFLLFGRRKMAVTGAVAGAASDALALLFLLLGLWSFLQGVPAGGWLVGVGAGVLAWRHLRYRQALARNRYPASCIFYYTVGSFLFAVLMAVSARKHLRGKPLRWKGREYVVPTK
jgi:glycosyltransferase involved in cell wall biosynthesis